MVECAATIPAQSVFSGGNLVMLFPFGALGSLSKDTGGYDSPLVPQRSCLSLKDKAKLNKRKEQSERASHLHHAARPVLTSMSFPCLSSFWWETTLFSLDNSDWKRFRQNGEREEKMAGLMVQFTESFQEGDPFVSLLICAYVFLLCIIYIFILTHTYTHKQTSLSPHTTLINTSFVLLRGPSRQELPGPRLSLVLFVGHRISTLIYSLPNLSTQPQPLSHHTRIQYTHTSAWMVAMAPVSVTTAADAGATSAGGWYHRHWPWWAVM